MPYLEIFELLSASPIWTREAMAGDGAHPLLLGGGKALFAGVTKRRSLKLEQTAPGKDGKVVLTYRL